MKSIDIANNVFMKKSDSEKVNILYNALDYMSQYNDRSKSECISLAMGYTNREGDMNTWVAPIKDTQ